MEPNPYKTPASPTVNVNDLDQSLISVQLFSAMFWSNVGLGVACLLFAGMDWLYVNWGTAGAQQVNVAWSKLFFIVIGFNVITFFTYVNRKKQRRREGSKMRAREKRQQ